MLGQQRLDHLAAALANAHAHAVRLGLDQQALFLQVGEDSLARGEAIHTCVGTALAVERSVLIQNANHRQAVALTHLVVILIVGRGDLHRA